MYGRSIFLESLPRAPLQRVTSEVARASRWLLSFGRTWCRILRIGTITTKAQSWRCSSTGLVHFAPRAVKRGALRATGSAAESCSCATSGHLEAEAPYHQHTCVARAFATRALPASCSRWVGIVSIARAGPRTKNSSFFPQESPRRPQEAPKRPQEAAKRPPSGPKRPPRGPNEAPKLPPRGFRTASQRLPRGQPRLHIFLRRTSSPSSNQAPNRQLLHCPCHSHQSSPPAFQGRGSWQYQVSSDVFPVV